MNIPKNRICPKGHDKLVVGFYKTGYCKGCRRLLTIAKRVDPTKDSRFTQICPSGHGKNIVGHTPSGDCRECIRIRGRERTKRLSVGRVKKKTGRKNQKICVNGHDTSICGRDKRNACILCKKQWAILNVGVMRASSLKARSVRSLSFVAWTDYEEVKKIYQNQPPNTEIDHIIPIQGKYVFGLTVSWNLQYLTPEDNHRKSNNCDLLQASEWYGKILEEAGIKKKK